MMNELLRLSKADRRRSSYLYKKQFLRAIIKLSGSYCCKNEKRYKISRPSSGLARRCAGAIGERRRSCRRVS